MAQSKASLETAIRNDILSCLIETLSTHYDTDVMDVSASELVMPVVDAEVAKAASVPFPSEEFDRLVEQFNVFVSKL
mgnify:CR=1 FL=1